jgi:uncharacterized protein YggU (UPF0235/DUF167 family)
MPDKLVPVEALRELNIPGQKTKKLGAKLELPEATVKILEVGENASLKRVEVEKVVSTTVNKTTTGDAK